MVGGKSRDVLRGIIGGCGLFALVGWSALACSAADPESGESFSAASAEPGPEDDVRPGLWKCSKSAAAKTGKKQWWTCPDPIYKKDIGKGYTAEDLQYVYACPDGKTPKRRKCETRCIRGPVPSHDVCATDDAELKDPEFKDSTQHSCVEWADFKARTITQEEAAKANWTFYHSISYTELDRKDIVAGACAPTSGGLCCPTPGETIGLNSLLNTPPSEAEQVELDGICQGYGNVRADCKAPIDATHVKRAVVGKFSCSCVDDLVVAAKAECVGMAGKKDSVLENFTPDKVGVVCFRGNAPPGFATVPGATVTNIGSTRVKDPCSCIAQITGVPTPQPGSSDKCTDAAGPNLAGQFCSDKRVDGKECSPALSGPCGYCCVKDPAQ